MHNIKMDFNVLLDTSGYIMDLEQIIANKYYKLEFTSHNLNLK